MALVYVIFTSAPLCAGRRFATVTGKGFRPHTLAFVLVGATLRSGLFVLYFVLTVALPRGVLNRDLAPASLSAAVDEGRSPHRLWTHYYGILTGSVEFGALCGTPVIITRSRPLQQ